jgi:1-deoxy-D-xylulose-5-phosphate reductoisomerase
LKKIALIGSTGSIGTQVLNVVRSNPEKFSIITLSAGSNTPLFNAQVKEFRPKIATIISEKGVERQSSTDYYFGENAFTNAIVKDADVVVVSLVGYTGIVAVLDAINKGKNIALANKESLVVGGEIVAKLKREKGVEIVPIDSEHSAIWQALDFDFNKPFKKIILTASGGAFRDLKLEELKTVKAKDALKHPNWLMGNKITIDCATLVNKAFEVIEAKWLYNTEIENIQAVIHRESIIHSMVEFLDNSVIAQLSTPTMELPIQLALSYPERFKSSAKSLDFSALKSLTFSEIDKNKYPCFDLVLKASKMGGGYPAVINGANDMAVNLFLRDKITFNEIYCGIESALSTYKNDYDGTFDSLKRANDFARKIVERKFGDR